LTIRGKTAAHFVLIKRNDEPLYREWGSDGRSYDYIWWFAGKIIISTLRGIACFGRKIESNLIRLRLVSDSACVAVNECHVIGVKG